jgi:uncharacterized phiE125 gp8 family phage protein
MLRLITPPADPVVTLEEARTQCRVDAGSTADDADLTRLVAAATARLDGREGILGRALQPQTWDLVVPHFPAERCAIALPLPPTISVASVKYLDTTEAEQTLDPALYRVVEGGSEASRIVLKLGATWPQTAVGPDAVRVRFQAGYAAPYVIPEPIRHAILLLVDTWFENRSDVVVGATVADLPQGVLDLIAPHREYYAPEPV